MKVSKHPELDFQVLTALKIVIKNSNKVWHWLCEEHPQVALEYQAIVEREERGFPLEKPVENKAQTKPIDTRISARRKEDRLAIFRQLIHPTAGLKRHRLQHIIDRELKEAGYSQTYVLKADLLNAYPKSKAQAYQHFNSVEEHFDTHKEGSKVYVRLKEYWDGPIKEAVA